MFFCLKSFIFDWNEIGEARPAWLGELLFYPTKTNKKGQKPPKSNIIQRNHPPRTDKKGEKRTKTNKNQHFSTKNHPQNPTKKEY